VKVPPTIYLIAGANGVGKTTFAREFLPKEVNCLRFMNADEVARGLSPFAPEAASIRAGRVLIGEIRAALLVFPPPMPTKDLPEHVRRAMRAFERVHKMLEAKAAAERARPKRPGR